MVGEKMPNTENWKSLDKQKREDSEHVPIGWRLENDLEYMRSKSSEEENAGVSEMMTISPKGLVSICCEDFDWSTSFENVNQKTMREIWNSEKWRELDQKL